MNNVFLKIDAVAVAKIDLGDTIQPLLNQGCVLSLRTLINTQILK